MPSGSKNILRLQLLNVLHVRSTCSQCPLYTSHLIFDAPLWDICWWCPFQPHLCFFSHGHQHSRCGWPFRENISAINAGKLHMAEMDRRARNESHLPTREKIMGQRRKVKALAGKREFHLRYFLEVVIKQRSYSWNIRTFSTIALNVIKSKCDCLRANNAEYCNGEQQRSIIIVPLFSPHNTE